MPALIEVKYFNSFILKKTMDNDPKPVWNGSFGIPAAKGGYPSNAAITDNNQWAIEEARINGGFNNTSVSLGAKAYLVEEEPNGSRRGNSLIYSGIFNSRTGVNNTNVFPVGEAISKSLDPANGTVQKLYAEDTNLTIFQELKLSTALIDKDAIYSAEGGGAVTSTNLVIGAIQPIYGEYGISQDPTSFAVYGGYKYFTDKNNNTVLQLAGNSLKEISVANMIDYFRDTLGSDFPTGINVGGIPGTILGGWDIHNKQYVLSLKTNNVSFPDNNATKQSGKYETLSWDDSVQGWTSFYTYNPDNLFSLRNNYYTVKNGAIWEHYRGIRSNYYNVQSNASITFVFNPNPSVSKTFSTVEYEGDSGWKIESFVSGLTGVDTRLLGWDSTFDQTNPVLSYYEGLYDSNNVAYGQPGFGVVPFYNVGFTRKENKYVANLINNSPGTPFNVPGEVVFGSQISGIKGFFTTVKIKTDDITDVGGEKELFAVGTTFKQNNGY